MIFGTHNARTRDAVHQHRDDGRPLRTERLEHLGAGVQAAGERVGDLERRLERVRQPEVEDEHERDEEGRSRRAGRDARDQVRRHPVAVRLEQRRVEQRKQCMVELRAREELVCRWASWGQRRGSTGWGEQLTHVRARKGDVVAQGVVELIERRTG